ncbi:MAG TPA: hypothetical protein ACQGQH_00800 [Xylella sp.]
MSSQLQRRLDVRLAVCDHGGLYFKRHDDVLPASQRLTDPMRFHLAMHNVTQQPLEIPIHVVATSGEHSALWFAPIFQQRIARAVCHCGVLGILQIAQAILCFQHAMVACFYPSELCGFIFPSIKAGT